MREVLDQRRQTREVRVGNIIIGGNNPIVIQSMITEETANTKGAVSQIIALHQAGAEIVRITTPTLRDAQNLANIKTELTTRYQDVPLVADVHHQGTDIAIEASRHVEKVRINPGLFVYHKPLGRKETYTQDEVDGQLEEIDQALRPVVSALKINGRALRVGVNHGSLAERLMVMYGDTPLGMVESAMEYLKILERNDFFDSVITLKASDATVMIEANRLMVQRMDTAGMRYPLHLGVTEAGFGQTARVKSSIGIGTLLSEGIGDTIRVSLAEDPVNEIDVCRDILQSLGLRRTKMEFVACPGCGRTKFDLPTVSQLVEARTRHLVGLKIAVMGCIVNGPGEVRGADYGFIGKGGGDILIQRGGQDVKTVRQGEALATLISVIKEDGKWTDPPAGNETIVSPQLNKRPQF